MPDIPTPTPAQPAKRSVILVDNRVASTELLAGGQQLVIEHKGEEYRLRVTANNRLILTK